MKRKISSITKEQKEKEKISKKTKKEEGLEFLISEKSIEDLAGLNDEKAYQFFKKVAKELLNETVLYITEKVMVRFLEIEFYLTSKENHPDPFSHQNDMQSENSKWYFHRYGLKSSDNYKGGTYKGLDLVFGKNNDDQKVYGGILIRSFETKDNKIICGSCTCVNYILKQSKCDSIEELVEKMKGLNAFRTKKKERGKIMFLKEKKNCTMKDLNHFSWTNQKIHHSSRVGLTLKNKSKKEERINYIVKPYRFFRSPKEIKKGKINFICTLFKKYGNKEKKITKFMKIQKKTITKYHNSYSEGKELKSINGFIGKKLSVDLLCQLHGFLHK